MRTIILHYHLFKNAGTSIDKILKDNFGDKWVTREFAGSNNTNQISDWILSNPDAIAFSSHTMTGPIPKIADVIIVSIMILREPVQRITSAYKFERNQNADTWGAQLAKQTTFEEYVVARLQKQGDAQCRNFQVERLATLRPGSQPKVQRAIEALDDLTVVGIVERFETTLELLKREINKYYPDFKIQTTHANQSTKADVELGPALTQLLHECNKDDRKLWLEGLEIMQSKALPSEFGD
uniref:sulfotransferase family 2 domain-containing protein n=1 Tax=Synechococcus sp. UW106 TaxID=368495 RepID=UPI000E0E595D|nr:sulfotransferase family 2 domain-containing protein [Synechococcus sp. UW106]